MKKARFFALLLAMLTLCSVLPVAAEGEENETMIIHIDSVNGTRWENTTCVYIGRATTEQNEWGYNILVDKDGIVIDKVMPGNVRGRNLAIPDGGFVFSSVAADVKALMDQIAVGDHVLFDSYGSRVLVSKNEIDPFYEVVHPFTGYNGVRYEKTLLVFNQGGSKTGTNGWGYEVVVDRDGFIIASGGNDNTIPVGGFVLSAIEPADRDFLKTYCIVGAKCTLSGMRFKVYYGPEMLSATVKREIELMKEQIAQAEAEFRLVDTESVAAALDALPLSGIDKLETRNELIDKVQEIGLSLIETPRAGIVSVWYVPTETTEEAVRDTVAEMQKYGINQLCLGISNGYDTLVRLPARFPFATKRELRSIDLLAVFVDACHKAGIELVVSMPTFACPTKDYKHNDWLALSNVKNGSEKFYSPANDDFIAYLKDYVEYIITHYDIDGFQYDYVRYPYFDGKVDYGYDDATKELFLKKTGLSEADFEGIKTGLRSAKHWNEWVDFKRDLISARVAEISAMIREKRPDLYLSACLADDTGRDIYFQDAKKWISDGSIDGIYPMSYGEGIMGNSTAKFKAYLNDRSFLAMGCGAYLSLSQNEIALQTLQTEQKLADGIAYFEWTAYVQHGYAERLKNSVFSEKTLSFTYEESASIAALLETANARMIRYSGKGEAVNAAFEGKTDPTEIKEALLALVPYDQKLYADLDLAIRVKNLSRESFKGTVEILEHEIDPDPEESGSDVSETTETETAPESVPSESGSEEKTTSSLKWWLIGGGIALVAAAGSAFVLLRKKK